MQSEIDRAAKGNYLDTQKCQQAARSSGLRSLFSSYARLGDVSPGMTDAVLINRRLAGASSSNAHVISPTSLSQFHGTSSKIIDSHAVITQPIIVPVTTCRPARRQVSSISTAISGKAKAT